MKQPGTRELFAYWDALRGERMAPERCDIDPAEIRNVLADTFMLNVDLSAGYPFGLAGTRVNGLFDTELKARSFLSFWRPEERRNIAAVLTTVADGACPVGGGAAAAPGGREPCALELLFLPLRQRGKTHSRILGMITAANEPDWLGLLPLGPLALRSLRIVHKAPSEMREKMAVGQAMASLPAPVAAPTTRPYLRLIEGGL